MALHLSAKEQMKLQAVKKYACPIHLDMTSNRQGKCPKCGKIMTLSQKEKNLHEKAFTTNRLDPDYHRLTALKYKDGNKERELQVPKGDVLHQFREDVKNNQLPTV
jgi:hypothetical protein